MRRTTQNCSGFGQAKQKSIGMMHAGKETFANAELSVMALITLLLTHLLQMQKLNTQFLDLLQNGVQAME